MEIVITCFQLPAIDITLGFLFAELYMQTSACDRQTSGRGWGLVHAAFGLPKPQGEGLHMSACTEMDPAEMAVSAPAWSSA